MTRTPVRRGGRSAKAGRRFAACHTCLAWLGLGFIAASGALACGSPAGRVRIAAIDERMDVALGDGRVIRLAGLDGSIYRDPNARAAARALVTARFAGEEAELDVLAAGPDRWGRVPGDLSLLGSGKDPSDSAADALLRAGLARVRPEFEARSCALDRLAIEAEARNRGLGLWAGKDRAIVPASDLSTLRRLDGHFVIIEGRVRRVGFGRSRIYLDLAPRRGLSLIVPRKFEPALARIGPLGGLAGRDVRARGVIDGRFGLRLEVSDPAMIEVRPRPGTSGGAEARQ